MPLEVRGDGDHRGHAFDPHRLRLGEIITQKWGTSNFNAGVLNLPDSKTGAATIYLGKATIDTLRRLSGLLRNPWVIYGIKPGGRLIDPQSFWQRLRACTGLGRPHPRPAPHLRFGCRRRRPGPADDR